MADLIDRAALLADIEEAVVFSGRPGNAEMRGANKIIDRIEAAPTVDAEPVKHGRWLPQILLGQKVWDCSECKTLGSPHWKRRPVCEAKMDGERKET